MAQKNQVQTRCQFCWLRSIWYGQKICECTRGWLKTTCKICKNTTMGALGAHGTRCLNEIWFVCMRYRWFYMGIGHFSLHLQLSLCFCLSFSLFLSSFRSFDECLTPVIWWFFPLDQKCHVFNRGSTRTLFWRFTHLKKTEQEWKKIARQWKMPCNALV